MASLERMSHFVGFAAIIAVFLLAGLTNCQDDQIISEDILAERVKRDVGTDGDVTTVLLVDNEKLNRDINSRNGRYLNVKPVIGLLTSTARTFIQDGVTTEYATEVVGTTLDNGRVYAQLLTKSSLVLYDKPVEDSVKRTRLPFEVEAKKWNVEGNIGENYKDQFVIKNTDYISPKEGAFTVFASKPSKDYQTRVWTPSPPPSSFNEENNPETETESSKLTTPKEIPKYSEFEAFNFLDPLPAARERKISSYSNANSEISKGDKSKVEIISDVTNKSKPIEPAKVKPNINLPTFTVKNEFSPIFYYIDNVESKTEKSSLLPNYLKNAKKLFGHKDDFKPSKTFTYFGFADFTTTVGETVIVFSPSTADSFVKEDEVTPSVKAEVQPNVATKVKTFLSSDFGMVTKTMHGHQLNMETTIPTLVMQPDPARSSKALSNQLASLKNALFEKPIEDEEQALSDEKEKFNRVIASLKSGLFIRPVTQFGLHKDSIQPSESSYSTIQRIHATEKLHPYEETLRERKVSKIQATEPLSMYKSSSVVETTTDNKPEVVEITEDALTTQTEITTENSESGTTTEGFSETANTEDSLLTTQMEDLEEENIDSSSHDDNSGAVTCTEGIIPVSTMTTAYKTLTFLTTYFLPLEGTETTTSVNSREVVSTETGYLTNLVCKSGIIEPTPVVRLDIATTALADIEDVKEEIVTEGTLPTLTTENHIEEEVTEKTTTKILEETTSEKITTAGVPSTTEEEEKLTTTDAYTTEEYVSTSESHVEMSVTTESNEEEVTTEKDKINTTPSSEENEVDLIFKTLYTTYTYFTTYFQGTTSTVSSKKSVVTNVITSTLDISEIDPSIFNAIESSDYLFKATQKEELGQIIPTSVGAGRPTQTFAINSILDLVKNKEVIGSAENDAVVNSRIPTPELDSSSIDAIKPDIVKTFYTTYTFFTTLYVGQDINICSRSEVYTNFVGPASLLPSKTNTPVILNTKKNEIDFNQCKRIPAVKKSTTASSVTEKIETPTEKSVTNKPKQKITYTSIDRSNKKETLSTDESQDNISKNTFQDIVLEKGDSMFVTDVKSSYSKGDRQVIDNAILDDQISSESNIDEIVPSSTLLLQTSYTTFTYFTTMYLGKDSSKIKSRLETVTNVVTETLDPKTAVEETNLPITYYTTFTYWTTLYKDKTTTITSREDTISNVVNPTISPSTVSPIDSQPIDVATIKADKINKNEELEIKPSAPANDLLSDDDKATFYTTYTYYTTYYIGNSSEIRSSLETVTNTVDNTKDLVDENQLGRAVGKDNPANNLIEDGGKPIIKSTAFPDSVIIPTKVIGDNVVVPTQIVGSIVENKEPEKRILSSQVAVISGDSTIITSGNDSNKIVSDSSSSVIPKVNIDSRFASVSPSVIEGSVTEPTSGLKDEGEEDDEDGNKRKKSRLTFSSKSRTFTPAIVPILSSRSRPSFSPTRRGALTSGVTTITRSDFTPTITATPALKPTKSSGFGNRNRSGSSAFGGNTVSNGGRRFSRVSSTLASNSPSQRSSGFGRGRSTSTDVQTSSFRRGGFRTSSIRPSATDLPSRASVSRLRPTLSSRFRSNVRQTTTPFSNDDASTFVTDNPTNSNNEGETATQASEAEVASKKITANNSGALRFRRPPFTRAPTSPRTTTQSTAPNRNRSSANRRGGTTTTPKPTLRTTLNPLYALRNRQRPNSLFPPRGLINKTPEPKQEEESNAAQDVENDEALQEEDEEFNEDTDYDSSNQEPQVSVTSPPSLPARQNNIPNIRPFGFRKRSKRQADYGYRKNFSNFRRPTSRTAKPEPKIDENIEEIQEVTQSTRIKPQNRYNSRTNGFQNTQRPTRGPRGTTPPTTPARQQFILRGETTTQKSAFRSRTSRPAVRSSAKPTINSRPSPPRLKTYTTPQAETARSRSTARSRTRGRTTSRYRTTSNDIVDNNYIYQIQNDGKLTVTHKIPMEVTIPIVNGKVTEYKNVLTAKASLETLQPNQYSATQNAFGSQYLVLVSESSEPAENGATRVVQFILHETPTTSVIFTPTTIRGRKTSFSHIIPSTVYEVERVTSTIQPQINPNVPLANILLSQLLLGNIGMPQPQINPLLALQGQALVPGTPTTEFKVRTTTYVTSVTDAKSTVLPLTFRGKEILTTIVDSKVDVITATEFITDTIVVTPTVAAPQQNPNQLNSILLLLQQQQQLQQPIQQQTANPLLGLTSDLDLLQKSLPLSANDVLNSPKPDVLILNEPDDLAPEYIEEVAIKLPPKKKEERRKPVINKPIPPRESSVITLYVSGRHPGEFSTVLSTVYVDGTQNVQKREAVYYEEFDLNPSILPSLNDILSSSQSDLLLDTFVMPAMDNSITQDTTVLHETQSLESIIGEISKFMNLETTSRVEPTLTYVVKENNESVSER